LARVSSLEKEKVTKKHLIALLDHFFIFSMVDILLEKKKKKRNRKKIKPPATTRTQIHEMQTGIFIQFHWILIYFLWLLGFWARQSRVERAGGGSLLYSAAAASRGSFRSASCS